VPQVGHLPETNQKCYRMSQRA